MDKFKQIVLASSVSGDGVEVLEQLIRIILAQIRMERAGDIIDKHLVKSCSSMLDHVFETVEEKDEQRLYHVRFEPEFLASSREFYAEEAARMLVECDAGLYCSITKKRISEEMDRCVSTLIDSTSPKIVEVVEDELIRNRIRDLIDSSSGLRFMIDNNRIDELADIFELNARVDEKKMELVKAIQKKIIEQGTEINNAALAASQAQPAAAAPADGEGGADKSKTPAEKNVNQATVAALKWVEEVLLLKDRYDSIHRDAFRSDEVLQTALTRSFMDFINSVLFPRSSEYISLFIDENMKKGIKGKTEHEVDQVLEKAITLLKYVQDKDMFERYYKKHLCRRLLMNKSISVDVEKQMIGRMKIELGNAFTSKMEAMFKDMAISEELTSGYKSHVSKLGDVDPKRIELGVHVLTSMTWPLETMGGSGGDDDEKRQKCIFPASVERIKLGFEKFYAEKHSGRKLRWLPNMGTADIKATFPKVQTKDGFKERRHELNVSTYAMVILLLFNDIPASQKLSFEEIQARTNIPAPDLVRNLQSLAVASKTRILLKEPMSRDVKPTDMFSFNEGFNGRFVKIKVGVVTSGNKVESDKDRKDTESKVDENRQFAVEAALVRIMKYVSMISFPSKSEEKKRILLTYMVSRQRKKLTHTALVTEVLEQLKTFRPEIPMIKKRIESLIEREYLERVDDASVDTYAYLA